MIEFVAGWPFAVAVVAGLVYIAGQRLGGQIGRIGEYAGLGIIGLMLLSWFFSCCPGIAARKALILLVWVLGINGAFWLAGRLWPGLIPSPDDPHDQDFVRYPALSSDESAGETFDQQRSLREDIHE